MSMTRLIAVVCILTAVLLPATTALLCFQCSSISGLADLTTRTFCGIPFRNLDRLMPNVTCDGVCVTTTFFGAYETVTGVETISSVARLCSDVPLEDGCEYINANGAGLLGRSCLKTCMTDYCNDGSDASALIPSRVTSLLAAAVLACVLKRTL